MTAPPVSRWQRATPVLPPRMLLYGTPGVGKTRTAIGFPGAVVLQTEEAGPDLTRFGVPHTDVITSWADLTAALGDLFALPAGTLVIDSLDWLEPIVWTETCARLRVDSIEAPGYGKGYIEADSVWRELLAGLKALNQAGWCVICTAHAEIRQFDDPSSESYSRYTPKLHKRAVGLLIEWASLVGFAHWETVVTERATDKRKRLATGSGVRALRVVEDPSAIAKNRHGLAPVVPLDARWLVDALRASGASLPDAPMIDTDGAGGFEANATEPAATEPDTTGADTTADSTTTDTTTEDTDR